jgi:predicted RNase H-like nuclease (RuvC/YqgF family)
MAMSLVEKFDELKRREEELKRREEELKRGEEKMKRMKLLSQEDHMTSLVMMRGFTTAVKAFCMRMEARTSDMELWNVEMKAFSNTEECKAQLPTPVVVNSSTASSQRGGHIGGNGENVSVGMDVGRKVEVWKLGKTTLAWHCAYCGQCFSWSGALNFHIKKVHPGNVTHEEEVEMG